MKLMQTLPTKLAVTGFSFLLVACGGGGGGGDPVPGNSGSTSTVVDNGTGSTPTNGSNTSNSTPTDGGNAPSPITGNSGNNPTPIVSSGTTYTTVAGAGELITYNLNTENLTYNYTITESQFGLTGKTGSGTVTRLSDGTYSVNNVPGARVAILPNGLLIAAVRENFGGTVKTVPVIGLSNPVTSLPAAETYNFVQRSCISGSCAQTYGTFVTYPNGTWSSCSRGNLAAGPCPTAGASGTFNNLGNGKFQITDNNGSVNIGTAIAFNSNGQNVLIADLKDSRSPGFGTGILVGSQQQAILPGAANGTWVANSTSGDSALFSVSGTNVQIQNINGNTSNEKKTVTFNSPWAGMGTASTGGVGILAGSGVYVLGAGLDFAEIGIKIR